MRKIDLLSYGDKHKQQHHGIIEKFFSIVCSSGGRNPLRHN